MYGRIVVYFITFICLQFSSSADVLNHEHNVYCDARRAVVKASDEGKPYFVELYQCAGSVDSYSPRTKRCVAKTWNNVTIKLTTSNEEDEIILKNHTSCESKCAHACPSNFSEQDKDHCECTCNYNQPPPGHECDKNYAWDSDHCLCKCNLREGARGPRNLKRLDKENCKFVCVEKKCLGNREQSPDNCRCRPKISVGGQQGGDSDNTHQGKLIAALAIGEFVFLFLIFDFLLYSKKTGLMYYVRCKCRGRSAAETAQPEARHCLENENQENNVPEDVVVHRNGQSQVATGSCQHVSSM